MHGRPLFPGPNARHARPCTTLSSFYILSLAALLPHPLHAHAHSDASAPLADAAFSGCSARREAAIAAVCTGTTADTALKGVASFVPVSLSPGHEHEGAADDCCPLLLPACLPPPAACLPALSSCLPACPLQLPACLPSPAACLPALKPRVPPTESAASATCSRLLGRSGAAAGISSYTHRSTVWRQRRWKLPGGLEPSSAPPHPQPTPCTSGHSHGRPSPAPPPIALKPPTNVCGHKMSGVDC